MRVKVREVDDPEISYIRWASISTNQCFQSQEGEQTQHELDDPKICYVRWAAISSNQCFQSQEGEQTQHQIPVKMMLFYDEILLRRRFFVFSCVLKNICFTLNFCRFNQRKSLHEHCFDRVVKGKTHFLIKSIFVLRSGIFIKINVLFIEKQKNESVMKFSVLPLVIYILRCFEVSGVVV